jgi:hypothetical protein
MGQYDGFATLAFVELRQNAAAIRFVGRLVIPYRILVSALAIMHSPRSADFRWPRSRRRQPTPPHSPTSNRLKQEIARPPQFPQDDPSSPRGIRDSNISLVSLSIRWESGVSICPGLSTFTRIFLPFGSLSHVRANER